MAITAAPSDSGQSSITVAGTVHFLTSERIRFVDRYFSSSSSFYDSRSRAIVGLAWQYIEVYANCVADKRTIMERSFSVTVLWPLRLRPCFTNAVFEV